MSKCPHCGAKIGAKSTSCAICGDDFSNIEPLFYTAHNISTAKKQESPAPPQPALVTTEQPQSKQSTETIAKEDVTTTAPKLKIVKNNRNSVEKKFKIEGIDINANETACASPIADIDYDDENGFDAQGPFIETFKAIIVKPLVNGLHKFFLETKDETANFEEDDIKENSNFAVLSYLEFLFFIPMIVKPYSGYVRFHGTQGLNLFISSFILEVVNILLNSILGLVFSPTGTLNALGVFLTIITTVFINGSILLWIAVGIYNTVKGKARELPLIGRFRILK